MNDDQLATELRRRSDSAHPSRDWIRRDLLPSVTTAIDTRPQPVRGSPWAPLAGLAGVAAILVLLVVAMPGFVPGPSSSESAAPATPEPPFMSTADFASRLAAGELNGQTVLVNGRIFDPHEGQRGSDRCVAWDRLCVIGQLEGADPVVNVITAATPSDHADQSWSIDGAEWPGWFQPRPPIEGTLVFSISSDRQVEFIGRVRAPDEGLTFSVDEARDLDLNDLTLEEVVLASGWLTGIVAPISCKPPDPGTFIAGLPGRYCGEPTWLAPDPLWVDPSGYLIPETAMEVQSGAYLQFADNPTATDGMAEPRSGTYVVARRLEGSGCPNNAPPCWQWQVVGRLTEQLAQATQPTHGPERTTRVPKSLECAGDGRPVSLTDHTGLVVDCVNLPEVDRFIVQYVTNPEADPLRLRLLWGTSSCADAAVAQFGAKEPQFGAVETHPPIRYVLSVVEELIAPTCEGAPSARGIELRLAAPIGANLVAVDHHLRDSSPLPTATPSAPFECAYESDRERPAEISLIDHSGLVTGCEGYVESSSPLELVQARNNGSDQMALEILWEIPEVCSSIPVELELWGPLAHPGPAPVTDERPDFSVEISKLEPAAGPLGCRPAVSTQGVILTLESPVSAEEVAAFVTSGPIGSDRADNDAGTFKLTLESDAREYASEEPIALTISLAYTGPHASIQFGDHRGPVLGFEQLDGDREIYADVVDLDCRDDGPLTLHRDEPSIVPYSKEGWWSEDDPHADFYAFYLSSDSQLRLPSGLYRVFVHVDLWVNGICGETSTRDVHGLEASIVIRVR